MPSTIQNKEELKAKVRNILLTGKGGYFENETNQILGLLSQAHQSGIEEGAKKERDRLIKIVENMDFDIENIRDFWNLIEQGKIIESLKENNEKASKWKDK